MKQKAKVKYSLLIIFSILTLSLVMPVFDAILLAILGSFILYPIRKKLDERTNNRLTSTGVITLVILIIIGLFLAYSSYFTFQFMNILYEESLFLEGRLQQVLVENNLSSISPAVSNIVNKILNLEFVVGQNIAKSLGIFLFKFTVWIYLLFFLIARQEEFQKAVSKTIDYFTPGSLVKDVKSIYIMLSEMYRSFFVRYILSAAIVGVFAYIGFTIVGAPFAFLLAILCAVGSLLPGLATYVIYIPVAIWQLYIGNIWFGLFTIVYGTLFLTILPIFYLVPILTSGGSKIHPALVLLSLISGVLTFGVMGFVYGPFIAGLIQTIYNYYIKNNTKS